MARTLVAAIVAALAVTAAWLSLEQPRRIGEALAIAALAIAPALVPSGRVRLLTLAPATLAASWVAFGAQPWELLPFRDERVLAPMLRDVGTGVVDFYGVFLPFVPVRNPEMHSLVLCAIFGFTLAVGAPRRRATADSRLRRRGGRRRLACDAVRRKRDRVRHGSRSWPGSRSRSSCARAR